jgi:hypothetical protein
MALQAAVLTVPSRPYDDAWRRTMELLDPEDRDLFDHGTITTDRDPHDGALLDLTAHVPTTSVAEEVPDCASSADLAEAAGRARLAQRFERHTTAPVIGEAALHGLAGQIVRSVAPLTEANPAGILITLLCAFGALVGPGPCVYVGETPHMLRLFAVVLGRSGRDRKGESLRAVEPIIIGAAERVGSDFAALRLDGLSSGEGLVEELAREVRAGQALLIEEEFAKVLAVAGREQNTLSHNIRKAWDGRELSVVTRNNPLSVTGVHLNAIGHVTLSEVQATLKPVDICNGFGNRFLWLLSQRARVLPTPGRLDANASSGFADLLAERVMAARQLRELPRTAAFTAMWEPLYHVLESQPTVSMVVDNLTARGPAQLIRLSLAFALLDGRQEVDADHLVAALAVWEHAEATVGHVWGMKLASPRMDKVFRALLAAGPDRLSRKEIMRLFSNNLNAEQVDEIFRYFDQEGLGRVGIRAETGGRSAQVLYLV